MTVFVHYFLVGDVVFAELGLQVLSWGGCAVATRTSRLFIFLAYFLVVRICR
jgi:hypothetical protein